MIPDCLFAFEPEPHGLCVQTEEIIRGKGQGVFDEKEFDLFTQVYGAPVIWRYRLQYQFFVPLTRAVREKKGVDPFIRLTLSAVLSKVKRH
jgi:hypothetical protein